MPGGGRVERGLDGEGDVTGERAKLGAEMLLLQREGWAVEDLSDYFSLTPRTCRALMWFAKNPAAEWPKVVTRVETDGSWRVVREAM